MKAPVSSRSVQDVIEDIGFGQEQVKALLLGGGVWAADGAELLLIGSVTRVVSDDWGLNAAQRGFIVSVVFLGVLVGNAMSGWLGDSFGRRLPVVLSYWSIFIFSIGSALAWDIWSMVIFRMAVGVAFGIGQPAWNTYAAEFAPAAQREIMNGYSQLLFVGGEMFAVFLLYMEDPELRNMDWRRLLALGAIPSFIFGATSYFGLRESPPFLASKGQHDEAKEVLRAMAVGNSKDNVNVEYNLGSSTSAQSSQQVNNYASALRVIFGRNLGFTTFTVCLLCFTLNFNYYGGIYAFPQVLPELDLHLSPAGNLALGAIFEVPGFIAGTYLCGSCTRKMVMNVYLSGTLASIILFLHGVGYFAGGHSEWAIMVGFLGMKMLVSTGFIVIYLYASEIYPISCRATGTAVCIAFGRIGAMACPMFYEILVATYETYTHFFGFIALLSIVNMVFVFMLTIETKGHKLEEEHQPINTKEP